MTTSRRPAAKATRMTLQEASKRSKKLRPGEKTAKQLAALKDNEIDYSEIPELTEDFWRNARLLRPSRKSLMTLRLDDEVIGWFKKLGKGYQAEMNAVLRAYVETVQ